jgi:hypothetical protein
MGMINADLHYETIEQEIIEPLKGVKLTEVEFFVASQILEARSEAPIKMAEIMDRAFERRSITLEPRQVRVIVRSLRRNHGFPILHPQGSSGRLLLGQIGSRARSIRQRLEEPVSRRDSNAPTDDQNKLPAARRPAAVSVGGISMARKYIRDLSRTGWTAEADSYPGTEIVQLGCLQRIADSTEKMASNYTQLQNDLDWYKRQYAQQKDEIQHLRNSRAGYIAALTRLKNKIADENC